MRIHRHDTLSLSDLADWLNAHRRRVEHYYGGWFYRTALHPLLRRLNIYLRRWAAKTYRRLRSHKRFTRWWAGLLQRAPGLSAQWRWVRGA